LWQQVQGSCCASSHAMIYCSRADVRISILLPHWPFSGRSIVHRLHQSIKQEKTWKNTTWHGAIDLHRLWSYVWGFESSTRLILIYFAINPVEFIKRLWDFEFLTHLMLFWFIINLSECTIQLLRFCQVSSMFGRSSTYVHPVMCTWVFTSLVYRCTDVMALVRKE
jgi:hypothetical protein